MSEFEYSFDKEYKDVIEEVTQKYGYNDELKRILSGITKAVTEGKSYEDRQRFYGVLRETPIVVVQENDKTTRDELCDKMIGDVNPHIKAKAVDRGEYDKQVSAGSFITQPILDKDLNIIGDKKFLFIRAFDTTRKLNEREQKFLELFQTGINVSHLIHELGHAYAAAKNPYSIEDNILTVRTGACQMQTKLTPLGNGQYESEMVSTKGLYIEEALNTNFEEDVLAKYLGISKEELKELYGDVLNRSFYQMGISTVTEGLTKEPLRRDIDRWRNSGDEDALRRVNNAFSKTNFYENRNLLYQRDESVAPNADGNIVVERNRIFNNKNVTENTRRILDGLAEDFFTNPEEMTPIDMLDNMLKEGYDTIIKMYNLPLETFAQLLTVVLKEGNSYVYQAEELIETVKGIEEPAKQ